MPRKLVENPLILSEDWRGCAAHFARPLRGFGINIFALAFQEDGHGLLWHLCDSCASGL